MFEGYSGAKPEMINSTHINEWWTIEDKLFQKEKKAIHPNFLKTKQWHIVLLKTQDNIIQFIPD